VCVYVHTYTHRHTLTIDYSLRIPFESSISFDVDSH